MPLLARPIVISKRPWFSHIRLNSKVYQNFCLGFYGMSIFGFRWNYKTTGTRRVIERYLGGNRKESLGAQMEFYPLHSEYSVLSKKGMMSWLSFSHLVLSASPLFPRLTAVQERLFQADQWESFRASGVILARICNAGQVRTPLQHRERTYLSG